MPNNSGYVDPSRPSPMDPGDAPAVIYGYVPASSLCSLGIVTFFLVLMLHLVRTIRARAWFTVPFVVSAFAELLGYVFRALSSHKDPYKISFFVAQYFLITTAPILITASMYICLTRLLRLLERHDVPIPAFLWSIKRGLILWTFITADIVTSVVQIAGSALIGVATSKHKSPITANNVVLAGIAIQTFFFCIYLILLSSVMHPVWKFRHLLGKSVNSIVTSLWIASILVLIRLVFRLAESGDGVFGFVWTHEAFFGVLEYATILLALVLVGIWYPGRDLSRKAVSQTCDTGKVQLHSLP